MPGSRAIARKSRQEITWALVAAGTTVVAGIAARKAIEAGWRKTKQREPPGNAPEPELDWQEALVWTTFISLMVGMARLFARRGVVAGWRRVTGQLPPGISGRSSVR